MTLNRFVSIQGKENGRKQVCSGEMLLLLLCSVSGESDGDELAFLRYMECVTPLDEVDEALKCVCLQWVTSNSAEYRGDVGERVKVKRRRRQKSGFKGFYCRVL